MKKTRITKSILIAMAVISLFGASPAIAENYVSFRGGFYITLPEDWIQIDYNTADLFLRQFATDQTALEYEAVFAPTSSSPFFASDYLILTLDSMEWLYDYQIDSVVEVMNQSFGVDLKYFPVWDFLADVKSDQPVYDKENQIFSVVNDVVQGDVVIKKNLLIKKFYDGGVVNFFFYALDSAFDNSKLAFQDIVKSFSTENLEQALPKEDVKIAEIDDDDSIDLQTIIIAASVALLAVIIILVLMQRASKRKYES